MNEYQIAVLKYALAPIIMSFIFAYAYFILSENESLWQKFIVSSHPLIFVAGYCFALIGSRYFEQGSWESGEYVRSVSGNILENILIGMFLAGALMSLVSTYKYKGGKLTKLLIIPTYLVALITVVYIWYDTVTGLVVIYNNAIVLFATLTRMLRLRLRTAHGRCNI